ncbi:MAG: hypothetical protein NZV14_08810 [Bryobacteraceae bacterium]|nr:hypothetical protein [Bryobacteraceae bacterium]MDW8378249.1 hypothetical protein [Bryobacterales bacterium]
MTQNCLRQMGAGAMLSALAALCAIPVAQAAPPVVRAQSVVCDASTYPAFTSNLAMYIWSDKYVYRPGESLTLRWTVKTNGDTYPYSIVAYRQNNQNGKKFYVPANNETVTDIFGKTPSEGFQTTSIADGEKGVLLGEGGLLGGPVTIPNELGMHTLVVQLRDCTGTRVVKAAYMKIGVVDEFVDVRGNISTSRTWVNTKAYRVSGIVFVNNNAVLTIEPGTFVIGQPGSQPPSVLVITRNGRIHASGTKSRPIIMTSSRPFGERQRGDWGGLILLGRAPVNTGAGIREGNRAGEFVIEGLPATEDTVFGGTDVNHNCGTLRYVRVEYAGSILSPNNETNSFTWGGCGKQTVGEYLQATYGLDDAFEWFGGTNDVKYFVGGLHADDFVDYQLGWTGRAQFGVFYQSPNDRGNRGIEADNSEYNNSAEPFSNPTLYNMTFIGSGQVGFDESSSPGIFLRRGARGTINNMVVTNFFSTGVLVSATGGDGPITQAQIDNGTIRMNGILLWRNGLGQNPPAGDTVAEQVDPALRTFALGQRGEGRNFVVADPRLRRPFEYSDPDFRGGFGSAIFSPIWISPPDDGFFTDVNFVGGIGDENWMEEWTSFLQDSDIK